MTASGWRCGSEDSSPTHATVPRSTITTEAPAANSIELPRDNNGYWSLEGIISGKHVAVVQYYPNALSPEERRSKQAGLGLFDLQTKRVQDLVQLGPGEQSAQNANDGKFLAWTEAGVPGVKDTAWKLYAEELEFGGRWLVASGSSPALSVKPYGSALSIDGGRLVYASENRDGSGTTLKLVDLQSHASKDVAAASGGAAVISVALHGSLLAWVSATGETAATTRTLHSVDLATGAVSELGRDFTSTAIGGPGVVAAGQSVEVFNPGSPSPTVIASTPQGVFDVKTVDGYAAWIDVSRHRAMMASLTDASVKPSMLADEYAGRLFADGTRVYWMAAPELDKGGPATHLYVRWRDLK